MHKLRKLEQEDTYPFVALMTALIYFTLVLANLLWQFNPFLVQTDYGALLVAVFMACWGLHWFTFDEALQRVKESS